MARCKHNSQILEKKLSLLEFKRVIPIQSQWNWILLRSIALFGRELKVFISKFCGTFQLEDEYHNLYNKDVKIDKSF